METTVAEKRRARHTAGEGETRDGRPRPVQEGQDDLYEAVVWLLRGEAPVPVHALCEELAAHVAGGAHPAVEAALSRLVAEGACELGGDGDARTARLDTTASVGLQYKVMDMDWETPKAAEAGLGVLDDGQPHDEREVADRVSAEAPGQWGPVVKALITAQAMARVRAETTPSGGAGDEADAGGTHGATAEGPPEAELKQDEVDGEPRQQRHEAHPVEIHEAADLFPSMRSPSRTSPKTCAATDSSSPSRPAGVRSWMAGAACAPAPWPASSPGSRKSSLTTRSLTRGRSTARAGT
jgi:hypothetical protein